MHKTKVAIVLPNLGIGGAETQLISIANQLNEKYEFHFILFSKFFPLANRIKTLNFHTFSSPVMGLIGLPALLRKLKCQIVISSIIDMNLLVLAIKSMLPTGTRIITREALDPLSAIQLTRFPKFYGWLYRTLYPKSDRIISLSATMTESITALIGLDSKEKIHIISNGVDHERMYPTQPTFSAQKIIAVGRLDYQKGYDQLIIGFSKYLNQSGNKDITLTIYGEGPLRTKLESLIRTLDIKKRVLLPGTEPAVIRNIQSSSFLVVSSRFEGMSNVMLEALVNGVPVLSTKENTSADWVINSSNGLLIPACDPDTIADGLTNMIAVANKFDRQKIASNARNNFSIETIATRYAELFDVLAS